MKKNLIDLLETPLIRTTTFIITIIASIVTIFPQGFEIPENVIIRFILLVVSATFLGLFAAPIFSKPKVPIYEYRMKFMKGDLKKFIEQSTESVKILNVLFTYFTHLTNDIYDKITKDNVYFEFLLLKRIRNKNDISYLSMRENDEDSSGLINDMNKTLFRIFKFLIKLAREEQKKDGANFIHKLQVKEYSFMPVMCEYIFDEKKVIFGPYIAKDCHFIPLIQLEKNEKNQEDGISMAFNELKDHYDNLSENENHPDKEYIPFFSFFDGKENSSIHQFIENNLNDIEDILKERNGKYTGYLDGKNDFIHDPVVDALGKSLEGRFDAVIRDIKSEIKKRHNINS